VIFLLVPRDPSAGESHGARRLSSTLANFSKSSGAWNAEHRIVLDDVVGTLEHEIHAAEAAKCAPATMDVGPIKQLETIRIGDRAQPGDRI
jgi:hypothetical protein